MDWDLWVLIGLNVLAWGAVIGAKIFVERHNARKMRDEMTKLEEASQRWFALLDRIKVDKP